MIIKAVNENIFNTEAKHIAFATSIEGWNNTKLALDIINNNYWREIEDCGEHEMGTVISKQIGDKTFHALVCYSYNKGWGKNQADNIRTCLDKIETNGEPIAITDIGEGSESLHSDVSFPKLLCGMQESKQDIILYTEWYSLDRIQNLYKQIKETERKEKELLELKEKAKIKEFLNRETKYEIIKDIINELGDCELEYYIRNIGFTDVGQHNVNVRREEILNYLEEMNTAWNEHHVDMTDRQYMKIIKPE